MKTLKYILGISFVMSLMFACQEKEFGNLDFITNAPEPQNIGVKLDPTTNNSGVVRITPLGEGVENFEVLFGDATTDTAKLAIGEFVDRTYTEGSYTIKVIGYNSFGKSAQAEQDFVLTFKAPENLNVEITNDLAVSKQVNVVVTADYGISYDVYFGEQGNDTPVSANIGDKASYIYQNAGTYTIRVVVKSAGSQTTEHVQQFDAVAIMQPTISAPVPPARNAADVISIFSSAYADLPGTNFNPDWGQSGQGSSYAEFDLSGDKMQQYIKLSYQGIGLADGTSADVSAMEYLHVDIWTADVTAIEISLINGVSGTVTEKPVTKSLVADSWNSLDIPLTEWTSQGLSIDEIFQLKLVGTPWAGGTVFVDNIYFYVSTPSAPASGAPDPTFLPSTVSSVYSDLYTSVGISELNPGWGQTTSIVEESLGGNNTWKYTALNYTGIVTDYGNPTDLSARTHVYFNYWTPDATSLSFKIVNTVIGAEDIKSVGNVVIGSWQTVSIDLDTYNVDRSQITQMLFESSGATVYIDNLLFYTEIPGAPVTGAPIPTHNAANVIALFSDSYTPITVNEWNPGWGQTTLLTTESIGGNNALKYENLDYTGIVTDYGNPTNLTSKTHVHFDYWTPNAQSLKLKIVNTVAGVEDIVEVNGVVLGSWQSVDFALDDYAIDRSNVTQLLFESNLSTVYIDNLYFY